MKLAPALAAAFAAVAAAALVPAAPARAASSTSSAVSDSVSTSVGSISGSFERSSDASSKGKDVAAGDYRVIEVAEVAARPDDLRLTLRTADPSSGDEVDEFFLYVPRAAVAQHGIARGHTLQARTRPYGVEFAHAAPGAARQAFFLLMDDAWYRELRTTAVTL